jgi:hypothetical protein
MEMMRWKFIAALAGCFEAVYTLRDTLAGRLTWKKKQIPDFRFASSRTPARTHSCIAHSRRRYVLAIDMAFENLSLQQRLNNFTPRPRPKLLLSRR